MKKQDKMTGAAGAANAGLQPVASKTAKHRAPWLKKYAFKPGQSGNKSGRRKGAVSITSALKAALAKGTTAAQCAQAILDAVLVKKDPAFARILLDRTDGLMVQSLKASLDGQLFPPMPSPQVLVQVSIPSNGRGDSDLENDEHQPRQYQVEAPAPALPSPEQTASPERTAITGNPALHVIEEAKPQETQAEKLWRQHCDKIDAANREAESRIAHHADLQAYGHRHDKPASNSL